MTSSLQARRRPAMVAVGTVLVLGAAVAAAGPAPVAGAAPAAPAAVVAAPAAKPKPSKQQAKRRPDVIVVMTDDQRVGSEKGMPYLWDTLRQSMRYYPNAAVPNNNCCPSRSSFLTGQYSHTTGVWDNTESGPPGGWRKFFTSGWERKTINVALRKRGYNTVLLGKYVNQYSNFNDPRKHRPPGWSDFRTYSESNGGYWSPPHPIVNVPEGYSTDTLGDVAAATIAATPKNRPLFLFYSPFAPHEPANAGPYKGTAAATGALDRMRRGGRWGNPSIGEADRSDKPAHNQLIPDLKRDGEPGVPFPKVRRFTEDQADSLMGVDANLRKIVRTQQQLRNWRNTIVVYMSDNGMAWGDHALFDKTTPYRLTDGIPLLIKYPRWARMSAGTDKRFINQLDVTATIAELTGAKLATAGYSTLDRPKRSGLLISSPNSKRGYPYSHPSYCAWRNRDGLYVRYGDGSEELYDYANDPYELNNQAGNPAYAVMKTGMSVAAHLACNPVPPNYERLVPTLTLAQRTPAQTRVTLRPAIGSAMVNVQRLTKQGWVRIGGCKMPAPISTSVSRQFRVAQPGAYRARALPIGSYRTSGWTQPVRMTPTAKKFVCR